jgi:hydrogenase expression/formation protein HypD
MKQNHQISEALRRAIGYLKNYDGPEVRIMEVCGTHTHEIFKQGVRQILSPEITLISGPGCPVCVTPAGYIDRAVALALDHGVTVCTFGDLMRVPGTEMSLSEARGRGGDVRVVYAPGDAEKLAAEHPDQPFAFLSVGFETTTPSSCLAVDHAIRDGLDNFMLLTANKTMPAAYEAMKDSTDLFLYPGHVHAITGLSDIKKMQAEGVSGVVAGFTAGELIAALALAVKKYGEGEPFYINAYPRVVTEDGSPEAQKLVSQYMEPCDAWWRGIGMLPGSGMHLKKAYAQFDAAVRYALPEGVGKDNPGCHCGDVLQGRCRPEDCPLFGTVCTPVHPTGACMVSSEGACSAFYLYGGKK